MRCYIGCKSSLLENIKNVIDENISNANIFCDIFSGTSVVSRYFKQYYQIISNDLLYFSYVLQKATIENNNIFEFNNLKNIGVLNPIEYFNNLDISDMECLDKEKRFFQNTYAPMGGRMYVNNENALRIDFARNTVEDWYNNGLISDYEYYYLIACIVEGIPYIANIAGTYGAYLKKWDKETYKKYKLIEIPIFSNNKNNKSYNENGIELLKNISGDILYADPPYNHRQYISNYHVLETAAVYDFPQVSGVTGQRPYENKKSDFCIKKKALNAFENLIKNANFKHIILSYSTDGIISLDSIREVMCEYGNPDTFKVYEIPYKRYKSHNNSKNNSKLKELLIYVRKAG